MLPVFRPSNVLVFHVGLDMKIVYLFIKKTINNFTTSTRNQPTRRRQYFLHQQRTEVEYQTTQVLLPSSRKHTFRHVLDYSINLPLFCRVTTHKLFGRDPKRHTKSFCSGEKFKEQTSTNGTILFCNHSYR